MPADCAAPFPRRLRSKRHRCRNRRSPPRKSGLIEPLIYTAALGVSCIAVQTDRPWPVWSRHVRPSLSFCQALAVSFGRVPDCFMVATGVDRDPLLQPKPICDARRPSLVPTAAMPSLSLRLNSECSRSIAARQRVPAKSARGAPAIVVGLP